MSLNNNAQLILVHLLNHIDLNNVCSYYFKIDWFYFQVLKILSHLIHNGHANFRNNLRENDASLKIATTYSGPPDPLLGTSLYEEIRKLSKVIKI